MPPVSEPTLPRGWRSLRWRIPFFAALLVLAITVVSAWMAYLIIARHGEDLERSRAQQAVRSLDIALADQFERLTGTLTDYARWDAAYAFLNGNNPTFTDSDLSEASLERLGLAAEVMVDRHGVYRLAWVHDPVGKAMPLPAEVATGGAIARLFSDAMLQPRHGLVWFDGGPALYAAAPVHTTKGDGDAAGAYGFIARLDQPRLERLGNQIEALSIVAHRLADVAPETILLNPQQMKVYHQQPLLEGSYLSFDITFPRHYRQEVTLMTITIAVAIAFSGLITIVAVAWFLDRLVLRRITSLASSATAWGRGEPPDHLPCQAVHPDELSVLARAFASACHDLIQARHQAEQANRAKSAFLAILSHDIRVPLNGILGMTEMALEGDMATAQRERIEMVRTSGVSLMALVNDSLDLAKIEAGRMDLVPEPCPLAEVVREVAELVRFSAAPGVEVVVEIMPGLPSRLMADPRRLRQILWNVVGNAVKFTRHGEVRITLTSTSEASGVHAVACAVRDSGPGITPEEIQTLFQPFQQGSAGRKRGGTGLGLMISKSLAVQMGGDLTVVSAIGQGSTFTAILRLLVADEVTPAAPQTTLAPDGHIGSVSLRILVAEDDLVNQAMIRSMLMHLGHTVTVVTTGIEALDRSATQEFDLILMDYHMPEMDGLTATRKIRLREVAEGKRRTLIIGLTADAIAEDLQALQSAGMDVVLTKPVSLKHMADSLGPIRRQIISTAHPT